MPIHYKINIIQALKEAGYSTYRLRKEKLLGEATIQKLRNNELVSWDNISTICKLLNCQPGDIVRYLPGWIEDRIIELTDQRKEELTEYYEDKWRMDDSSEEELGLKYQENYIWDEIEHLEQNDNVQKDYTKVLYKINQKYRLSQLEKSWDEIKEQYSAYFLDIQDFFSPFIVSFNKDVEEERKTFIERSVKAALESEKTDIEKQAVNEYTNE